MLNIFHCFDGGETCLEGVDLLNGTGSGLMMMVVYSLKKLEIVS